MRGKRALARSLCTVPGHDMVWGLDIGWISGLVPDKYDGLDIGWCWGQELDMTEGPDMNWGWVLVRDRSECLGPGWTWGCWTATGTQNMSPSHRRHPSWLCREHL